MSKIRLLRTVILLASAIGVVFSVKPVQAGSTIHFDGLLWTPTVAGLGPGIHHTHITIPATSSSSGNFIGAGLVSVCKLSGDFDIRVSFRLPVWPSDNGVRASLVTGQPGSTLITGTWAIRISASTHDVVNAGESYLTFQNPVAIQGLTSTSDLSGSLREVRTGGTLTAYYLSGVNWISLGTWSVSTTDTLFAIVAVSTDIVFAHVDVKVTFRDFVITSGTLVCP